MTGNYHYLMRPPDAAKDYTMVHDFREGEILGELQDLEWEIEAVQYLATHTKPDDNHIKLSALLRLLDRLKNLKQHQEMRLRVHRQKVKDSGIKY